MILQVYHIHSLKLTNIFLCFYVFTPSFGVVLLTQTPPHFQAPKKTHGFSTRPPLGFPNSRGTPGWTWVRLLRDQKKNATHWGKTAFTPPVINTWRGSEGWSWLFFVELKNPIFALKSVNYPSGFAVGILYGGGVGSKFYITCLVIQAVTFLGWWVYVTLLRGKKWPPTMGWKGHDLNHPGFCNLKRWIFFLKDMWQLNKTTDI